MKRKPKAKRYNYYCLNCKHVINRRACSNTIGAARRCTECGSTNILREDHPLLTIKSLSKPNNQTSDLEEEQNVR